MKNLSGLWQLGLILALLPHMAWADLTRDLEEQLMKPGAQNEQTAPAAAAATSSGNESELEALEKALNAVAPPSSPPAQAQAPAPAATPAPAKLSQPPMPRPKPEISSTKTDQKSLTIPVQRPQVAMTCVTSWKDANALAKAVYRQDKLNISSLRINDTTAKGRVSVKMRLVNPPRDADQSSAPVALTVQMTKVLTISGDIPLEICPSNDRKSLVAFLKINQAKNLSFGAGPMFNEAVKMNKKKPIRFVLSKVNDNTIAISNTNFDINTTGAIR